MKPRTAVTLSSALLAALVTVLATAVRSDAYFTDPAALTGWYAAAWALFAAAAWSLRAVSARHVVPLVLAGSVAVAATGLLAEPRTSSDAFRYVWDGRVQAAGISPYDHAPADPGLAHLRDPWLFPQGAQCERPERFRIAPGTGQGTCTRINRPYVHTIYPPVAEGYFLLVHALSPPGTRHKPFQVGGALLAVATSGLLLYALRRRGDGRAAVYWAWCPAVAVEAVNNAHADALSVLFTVAAFTVVAARRPLGGSLLGAGIATKLLPAVTLPGALSGLAARGTARGRARQALAVLLPAAAVVALGYLPYILVSDSSVLGYLSGYTREEGYDDATVKNRYALLRLVLPDSWALPATLVVLAAVVAYVLRRGGPRRPWRGALLVTGTAFLLLTPGYSWYALLLIGLVALDGRWEWLGVAVAGAAKYIGGRAVGDPDLLGTVAYAVAALAVTGGWALRRGAEKRADPAAAQGPGRLRRTAPRREPEPPRP
ncbi:glycosyltransferase 87 family protein [Streptomyces sp. NPDC001407]|uniref:glycosyltransferase 87 family protein n=1 Tax=Streptomyces sp. NPDC001407 TaxID=3364573 RepID=UPI0036C1825A